MNSSFNSAEVRDRRVSQTDPIPSLQTSSSQALDAEASVTNDEGLLTPAVTVVIDPSSAAADPEDNPPPPIEFGYVQGVIRKQQVYIVTNLIDNQSQTLVQPQMVWTIGRNRDAALPLHDPMMSRRHAVILFVNPKGFYLIDLNSMNGSFVNGQQVRQHHSLQDGDHIRLGNSSFKFFLSQTVRSLNEIHPEVLVRLNALDTRPNPFLDYSDLEEPDVLFKGKRS